MKLVEFKAGEGELFEALTVVFFGADTPSPKELKASNKAEDAIEQHGIEAKDSKFKTVNCPLCRQRAGINPRIYTLPDGKGADLVLDDKVFDYILSRFDMWSQIVDPKLKRPFVELQDRFEAAKSRQDGSGKPLDDIDRIKKYLEKRDNP